jgi:hypothetical protein
MATREVKRSGKDRDGDITRLCGDGDSWSVSKAQAIADIESGDIRYKSGGSVVEVVVDPSVSGGKYLRTRPGGGQANNLDELEDC